MKKIALIAFCAPAALALSGCGSAEEPPSTIETGDAVSVEEPVIPMDEPLAPTDGTASSADPMAAQPMTEGGTSTTPSPGDQEAIDPATTSDPTVPENM